MIRVVSRGYFPAVGRAFYPDMFKELSLFLTRTESTFTGGGSITITRVLVPHC